MSLEITGKIIQIWPETGGTSRAGKEWKKQEFLIETIESYPKKVCLSVMGEKTNDLKKFSVGNTVTASLNIESREYQGKWYTDVRAWRIVSGDGSISGTNDSTRPTSAASAPTYTPEEIPSASSANDDLPF